MASISASADPKAAMRNRVIVTPEGVALDLRVASASARVGALMLDLALLFTTLIVMVIALALIALGYSQSGLPAPDDVWLEALAVFAIIALFLARNAYFLYFELGQRAATWGKRLMGIRVAARDGGRLSTEAIIARNLVRDIELFLPLIFMTSSGVEGQLSDVAAWSGTIWVAIFLLFPLLNKDRLRCGDLIAGTWVVESQRVKLGTLVAPGAGPGIAKPGRDAAQPAEPMFRFSEEELSVYGEFELQTLEKVLRSDNNDALETVCAAICAKIGWNPGAGYERAFLEAYYTQLRARLERNMRFGRRRADKFDAT